MDARHIGSGPGRVLEERALPGFSCETRDPDLLTEKLGPLTDGMSFRATRRGFHAQAHACQLPRLSMFILRARQGRVFGPRARNAVCLTVPTGGGFEVHDRGRIHTFRSAAAHFLDTAECFDARAPQDSCTLVAFLDRSLFESHLRALAGEDASEQLRLASSIDITAGAGASVVRYLRYVWRELQRDESLLRAPRIAREVEQTLAAMLVEACQRGDPEATTGGGEATVESLHRAEDFLTAHLVRPVALPEVASAAGATVRTLSRAFRRKHGIGPIAFLRRQRLEAARRDLRAAEGLSTTVTAVALRYGFEHLGRFAGAYRRAFGEAPSETLRSPCTTGDGSAVPPRFPNPSPLPQTR